MMGERTKELWKDPEYRRMMRKAHLGHKKPKSAYSFPKGFVPSKEHRKKISESKLGNRNPMWAGGVTFVNGYKKVKTNCEMSDSKGYIFEHRKVMSDFLGRKLKRSEVVHHKDGDITNNKIDNLELFSSVGEHTKRHFEIRKGMVEGL